MAAVTLLQYLQYGPPALPIIHHGSSKNTTNEAYTSDDIAYVGPWPQFNLPTILAQHGQTLAAQINLNPAPPPPAQAINAETGVRARFEKYFRSRLRRALRRGFQQLQINGQFAGLTALDFGEGDLCRTPDNFIPDTAYYDPAFNPITRPNRLPGDLKPSCKWSAAWARGHTAFRRTQFLQALSQVNFYMIQNRARYGFILTDVELVAIQRLPEYGHLLLSNAIPWNAQGNTLTVLLALWYLGLLASDDNGWDL